MTEAKRVTFTTISSTVTTSLMTAGSSGGIRFGADFLTQSEKSTTASTSSSGGTKLSAKTIRINVELFQTDSNKYPEFNYAKLLHLEKKKLKKLKQKTNGFSDPFEDNDDDVARIAKELEKKYGNSYSTGRSKNKRDDVDIGMGYDESDSFIDNTEAYDEIIPDEVETIEGGFYINCGALEFKKLHTESYTTKTDEIIKMPNRPKKRVISSSSEESSSSGGDGEDDEDNSGGNEESGEGSSVETSKSKSSTSTNGKKPKSATTSNPTKKKAVAAENGGISKKNKEKILTSASSSPKTLAEDRASDIERIVKKVEKTTTVKDMLKAQRDNFLKSQTSSSNSEAKSKSSAEDNDDEDSSSDESENDDDEEEDESDDNSDSNQSATQTTKDEKHTSGIETQGNEKLRISDTILPELESDVLSSIIEFRDGAKSQNLVGKKFQFDDKLSENFLKIDDSLLCLDKTQRNMVFAHLEFQLSLPKYYFLRKAKQLRIKEEKLKSKRTFNKLHKAVTETMPAVIASYEAELRRYTQLQANPNADQPPKMPKKKFPWNTNLRNLLYDVYQVRWTSYPVLGTRKETLEEFITSFMREKVVDIWPKGWMRYEELQKEIEKRKTAARKAKEKKKAASATTSGQSSPNPNVVNNPLTSINIANVSSLAAATTTAGLPNVAVTTTAQAVSFIKQFEEFTNRSNANSDTDSVASSSTSSCLKRKSTDTIRSNKPTKPKAPKLNGDQTKSIIINSNNKSAPSTLSIDLVSPSKRTDHSINHIMSPTEGKLLSSMTSSIFCSTAAAVSQQSKHSTSTHVIDLDNYKSVGDILQTSKQIQAAANAAALLLTTSTTSTVSRRKSSGDSEIEFVGVFPAKQQNKKLKTNTRNLGLNSNNPNTDKTLPSSSHHHSYQHSNNNNNRKKGGNSGLINLPGMDVNKIVNTFKELGDDLQIKPILKSTVQQQATSCSSTPTSQDPGSHQ